MLNRLNFTSPESALTTTISPNPTRAIVSSALADPISPLKLFKSSAPTDWVIAGDRPAPSDHPVLRREQAMAVRQWRDFRVTALDAETPAETPADLSSAAGNDVAPAAPIFNSSYGYGLVDAAQAVARAIGLPDFATVASSQNSWNLNLINAPTAWANGYTGQGIVVAVVDSGVSYQHPDLAKNAWINRNEIADNGIDDDGNGFIDDVVGWDFVSRDNDPSDENGHGTHVAGIIASTNNEFGTTGVAYDAQIMAVRVLNASGQGSSAAVADGIRYAANNGANVINLSLGGNFFSSAMQAAIEYATERGALVVMASGNEGRPQSGFPASLADQWGVSVGAVDRNSRVASFSNQAGSVPLNYVTAPGVSINSTYLNNSYRSLSGTSMATPHVAGVAALVLSANPNLTPNEVARLLTQTANPNGVVA